MDTLRSLGECTPKPQQPLGGGGSPLCAAILCPGTVQKHLLADGETEALDVTMASQTHAHEPALWLPSLVLVWQDNPTQAL